MTIPEILHYRNQNNAFARMLGIETVDLQLGYARAVMPITDQNRNPQGAVHGGVLYTLADIAGGNAAASHGEWVATIDSDFHFLRAGLNIESLSAEATELKCGKRFAVYSITVKDNKDTVLAVGTFSYAFLGRKIGE